MKVIISHNKHTYFANLNKAIDLSIPIGDVKCFFAPDIKMTPLQSGDFIGAVKQGAPINFFNVAFNPHGNGTHTECMGHITKKQQSVNKHLRRFHFVSYLGSVLLKTTKNGDQVITANHLKKSFPKKLPKAIILRTIPNTNNKRHKDYSGTNPPYLTKKAMKFLVKNGVKHLLLDLPSVDREEDGGKLSVHKIFWNYPKTNRLNCTITEMIFVPNKIKDGWYLLNLQIAPFDLDASPSKPVIYQLSEKTG